MPALPDASMPASQSLDLVALAAHLHAGVDHLSLFYDSLAIESDAAIAHWDVVMTFCFPISAAFGVRSRGEQEVSWEYARRRARALRSVTVKRCPIPTRARAQSPAQV